jgi:hypothetical protein
MNIDRCAECGKSLTALDIKHGWVNAQVGMKGQARVHTVCRSRFEARPLEEQKERLEVTP